MPELPEVEVLVCHLAPLLRGRSIRRVQVRRVRVLRSTTPRRLARALTGARFVGVRRRAKFLLFDLQTARDGRPFTLVGHLGMAGRMFLQPAAAPLPRHAVVVLALGQEDFVFEDPRCFGRLTLDTRGLETLGPEPLSDDFTVDRFGAALRRSRQAIKVKLLDPSLVAGVGNIYASEALFLARLSPRRAACRISRGETVQLWRALRRVLAEAIRFGSAVPLGWAGAGVRDGLFYYGSATGEARVRTERLRVYHRAGRPCFRCRTPIRRIVQAQRSTFYCPSCQR